MNSKTKFKETEIGKIPEDWEVAKLKEISDILPGYPFEGSKYSIEGIKVVRGENVSIGFLRWDTEKRWRLNTVGLEKYFLEESDIVIGMDGSRVGQNRAIISKKDLPLLLAQRVSRIRANEYADQKYLYYLIRSDTFYKYVESVKTGTSIPHISHNQIGNFLIPRPPIVEQRKISEILTALDAKIELNRSMNQTLESIAEALFKRWFVDFEFPDEKGQPYKSAGGKIIESELGQIPEGWIIAKLPEVCKVVDCLHSKKSEEQTEGPILLQFYNVGDMGLLDLTKIYRVSEEDYANWTRNIEVHAGDCIITNAGKAGAVAQIPQNMKFGIGRNITAIRPDEISSAFLIEYLLSPLGRSEIEKNTDQGTIFNTLNVKGILKLKVLLPSKDLLENYEKIASGLRRKMEENSNENHCLSLIRDSLLPRLMSGKIRVPV